MVQCIKSPRIYFTRLSISTSHFPLRLFYLFIYFYNKRLFYLLLLRQHRVPIYLKLRQHRICLKRGDISKFPDLTVLPKTSVLLYLLLCCYYYYTLHTFIRERFNVFGFTPLRIFSIRLKLGQMLKRLCFYIHYLADILIKMPGGASRISHILRVGT